VWEHPGIESGDSPADIVVADSAATCSTSVEADMGGGSGEKVGGLVKKAKNKASVDFSAVKEASAAKKIDSRKQGALAPENGERAENGGKDLVMHDGPDSVQRLVSLPA
jgi:hypothetical protein